MNEPIGIIGLGLLGRAIAERLTAKDYAVVGFDLRSPDPAPCVLCADAKDVIRQCQTVILCLPTTDVVCEVMEEVRDVLAPGRVIVDATTGDPEKTEKLAQKLAALDVAYIEANVAGSSELMRQGEAVLFIGGDADLAKQLIPLLVDLAPGVHYLGPVGSASRFKLVHNMILGLNRAVLAEGLRFAESLGVNTREALRVLQQTAASSRVMEGKGFRMIDAQYEPPQARLAQHLKDVQLMLKEAARTGARTPMTRMHRELLDEAIQLGFGEADNSAIIEVFPRINSRKDPPAPG